MDSLHTLDITGWLVPILVTLLMLLVGTWIIYKTRQSSASKKNEILLLGLSGSGKSALFFRVTLGNQVNTCTSMEENVTIIESTQSKKKTLTLVDLPGHPRLRFKVQDRLKNAYRIIFLIHPETFNRNIRANAEFLYDILIHPSVVKDETSVTLLLHNRQGGSRGISPDSVVATLEAEIDRLRHTRSARAFQQDTADGDVGGGAVEDSFLGYENEPFKFEHIPNQVETIEGSFISDDFIEEFRESLFE